LTDDKSCRPGIDQASVSSLHGLPSERLRRIEGSTRYSTTALRKSAMMSPPPASRADVAGPIPCGTLRSMSSSGGFPVTIPHPRPLGTGRPCGSWLPFADLGSFSPSARKGQAPQLMATFRNVAISLLRFAGASSIASSVRHCARNLNTVLSLIGILPT